MRKALKLSGLVAALSLAPGLSPGTTLIAHGGKYGGPTDTVPPNTGPGDTTPPGDIGRPGTTAPTPPTTGNGNPPTTGRNPTAPTNPTPGRASVTGASRRDRTGSFEQWEFWWEANDDAFLGLKERLRGRLEMTEGFTFTGRRSADPTAVSARVGAEERARIRDALVAALKGDDADVVDSSVLALARIVPVEEGAAVLPEIVRVLGHPAKTARESAALALGVLGAPDALPTLRELLLDTPEGRSLTGGPAHVEDLVRAFAAASIGMIGRPESIDDLRRAVTDESLRANRDVKSLALLGLGLIRGGHDRIVPFLQEILGDRALDPIVRAQAPVALARLARQDGGAARAALPALLGRFTDDLSDHDLRRSLAIALGRMASIGDSEIVAALVAAAAREKDAQTRHFSLVALGEIGARDPDPAAHAEAHAALFTALRATLSKPRPITNEPWAALALALYARSERIPADTRHEAISALRDAFLDEPNPSYKGACAVALGLIGAKEAGEEIAAAFAEVKEPSFRGYAAVASGLMLDRARADTLRELVDADGLAPSLRLQIARALGLLADPHGVPALVASFRGAGTLAEVASTAEALGLIGDRGAVEPLLEVLEDPRQPPLHRGFAAAGLGLLAEKSDLPWTALFTVASNYRAKTPALAEIFDIL